MENLSYFKLVASNNVCKIYENYLGFYIAINIPGRYYPVEGTEGNILIDFDSTKLTKQEIVYSIPSSNRENGGYGASDIALVIGGHFSKPTLISQANSNNIRRYLVNCVLFIPKLY